MYYQPLQALRTICENVNVNFFEIVEFFLKKIKYLFHSKVVRVSKISDSIVFTACYSFVSKRILVFVAL